MPRETKTNMSYRATNVLNILRKKWPDLTIPLSHKNPFELLVATILSAQTTDNAVNKITPSLFKQWPDAASLAEADPLEVEKAIATIGLFRRKSASIIKMAQQLVDSNQGEVPDDIEKLVKLAGVGRKTANVVLASWFNKPGLAVDTHVIRLSNLLGFAEGKDAERIEASLCSLLPAKDWGDFSLHLIILGRRHCVARRPKCDECPVNHLCPSHTEV